VLRGGGRPVADAIVWQRAVQDVGSDASDCAEPEHSVRTAVDGEFRMDRARDFSGTVLLLPGDWKRVWLLCFEVEGIRSGVRFSSFGPPSTPREITLACEVNDAGLVRCPHRYADSD
jgi:hypothetical protein